MKRGYLIVGGIGVGLLLLAFTINFFLSFGASRAATRFLARLSQGDAPTAYQMTTKAYRQEMKAADFSRMTRRWQLRDFSGTEDWENQPGNGQVMITTNVKRKGGTVVPLILKLSKEEGDWRIAQVQGPPPPSPRYLVTKGLGHNRERHPDRNGPQPSMPAGEEINRLVRTSLTDLDKAVKEGDFRGFRSSVAQSWDMPLNVFDRTLGRMNKEEFEISGVAKAQPVYEPAPEIGEDGLLHARGKYLLGNRVLDFDLTYTLEQSQWKLLSFWVGVRPCLPDEIEE